MPLYGRRKLLRQIEEQEAAGASFWTTEFSSAVRYRLLHALDAASHAGPNTLRLVMIEARSLILRDEGAPYLAGSGLMPHDDMEQYLLVAAEDDDMPSVIEALMLGGATVNSKYRGHFAARTFAGDVARILAEERISFEVDGMQLVAFESRELHVAVVAPTLALLSSQGRFGRAEAAYQGALRELSTGAPDDAITDAARALEETLDALGFAGGTIGAKWNAARKANILAPHDVAIQEGVSRIIDWVSADRAAMGDAHGGSSASAEDAWFTVHVVGALIVRLAAGGLRS